jgi:WD40 repeat protein
LPSPRAEEQTSTRTDLYGDALPEEAVSRLGTLRMRHGEFAGFVRFARDGKMLITQGLDGVRAWEVATGKQIYALPKAQTNGARGNASLSPDGKLLATSSDSGIHLWDVASGRPVRTIEGVRADQVRFSPDGTRLVTLTTISESLVELLDTISGRRLWSWSPGKIPLSCVAFSADGKAVIVAGWAYLRTPPLPDNSIRFLDVQKGTEQRRIELGCQAPDKIAVSPDGKVLTAICHSEDLRVRSIRVWDVASGNERYRIEPPVGDALGQRHARTPSPATLRILRALEVLELAGTRKRGGSWRRWPRGRRMHVRLGRHTDRWSGCTADKRFHLECQAASPPSRARSAAE